MNLQQRITDISKKTEQEKKDQQKTDELLRKMNEGADAAYANDISSRADISASRLHEKMNAPKPIDPCALSKEDYDSDEGSRYRRNANPIAAAKVEEKATILWCEAASEDGDIYYWNVKTNETSWEKPKEGYMKYAEYVKLNDQAAKQAEEFYEKQHKEIVENADELSAKFRREQLKRYQRVTKEPKPETSRSTYADQYGVYSETPLGKWETVESIGSSEAAEPVDLQLPQTGHEYVAINVGCLDEEPPVKKFREKTIKSLDDDDEFGASSSKSFSSFSFKKKTFGKNRNIRKATDE